MSNNSVQSDYDQTIGIAKEAYTYGFPLVLMNLTKLVQTSGAYPDNGHAPINQIGKAKSFPTSETRDVVKPNVDTYYNLIWFDLSVDAFVLNVPSTDQSIYFPDPNDPSALTGTRYYLLPFLDAYSNVFSSLGTRSSDSSPLFLFITGPDWNGAIPENMQHVPCPTNMVWMLGRIQANDDTDGERVVWPIEQQLKLTPYSQWDNPAYQAPITTVNSEYQGKIPLDLINALSISDYFNAMCELMTENEPLPQDAEIVSKMATIGVGPNMEFNINSFSSEIIEALELIPSTIIQEWEELMPAKMLKENAFQNNWVNFLKNIGKYGTDYLQRAFIAYKGLGANLVEDAIYPVAQVDSDKNTLMSNTSYKISMSKHELPKVGAFWSLTCYNQSDFLVANEANIYSVGSRGGLNTNEDQSVDIYIQPSPPEDSSLNWLPSPSTEGETMSLTMRLYWPDKEVVKGIWKPPLVVKLDAPV